MTEKARLAELLQERGLDEDMAWQLAEYPNCLGAITKYDNRGTESPGLLVKMVRDGDGLGFKPRGERSSPIPEGEIPALTDALVDNLRYTLNSSGVTREDAQAMLGSRAEKMGVAVDTLIDKIMGEGWQATRIHAAYERRKGEPVEEFRRRWANYCG